MTPGRWPARLALAAAISQAVLLIYNMQAHNILASWLNTAGLVLATCALTTTPAYRPDPPVNVRLEYPGGSVVPLECRWAGRDRRGYNMWQATITPRVDPAGASLACDWMPGHASLTLDVEIAE